MQTSQVFISALTVSGDVVRIGLERTRPRVLLLVTDVLTQTGIMASYRIICTTQEPSWYPNDRAHIVAVGTGISSATYHRYWHLSEILRAMELGDIFYTFGEASQRRAAIEKYECDRCYRTHIRSTPDAVTDNNLDTLPGCRP